MKTKKVIVGAIAATMLSLSVCSVAPAAIAAGETVQISVGEATASAGEKFSVEVSLADVPASGIQACDFSIFYDSNLITIDSVTAGAVTNTGADSSDPTVSMLSLFNSDINNDDGTVSLIWSTSLDDASYWINKGGVFCTLNGTVAANAAEGAVSALEIKATPRETYEGSGSTNADIKCGYLTDSEVVMYTVKTADGSVTVTGSGLKGDANCDGEVGIADAVLILQSISNPDKYELTAQGKLNADVIDNDGVTAKDALEIQKYEGGADSALGKKNA